MIQRTAGVSEERIEYVYEYRNAEYEYDPALEVAEQLASEEGSTPSTR